MKVGKWFILKIMRSDKTERETDRQTDIPVSVHELYVSERRPPEPFNSSVLTLAQISHHTSMTEKNTFNMMNGSFLKTLFCVNFYLIISTSNVFPPLLSKYLSLGFTYFSKLQANFYVHKL